MWNTPFDSTSNIYGQCNWEHPTKMCVCVCVPCTKSTNRKLSDELAENEWRGGDEAQRKKKYKRKKIHSNTLHDITLLHVQRSDYIESL